MIGRLLGPYRTLDKLGYGGLPSLAGDGFGSFGASTVAQARIWL